MRKVTLCTIVCCSFAAASLHAALPSFDAVRNNPKAKAEQSAFVIKDAAGKTVAVPLVDDSAKRKIVPAKVDPKMNPLMVRAATIAQERAHAHSKSRCWRYVKEALLAAGAVSSYPKTALAKQAGEELVSNYGFKRLPVSDPYAAPVGAVLGLWRQRRRPCRDPEQERVRERFPQHRPVEAPLDRRLRQDLAG